MSAFLSLIVRDLRLALAEGAGLGTALGFYLVVVTLLPLGLGPDQNLLSRLAAGMLWIALLLAVLISLPQMFKSDYEDGSLEVLSLSALPLELVVLAKVLAHWLSTGIALSALAPVLGLLLNLPIAAAGPLVLTMLAGTPAASAIGAIGAALTLNARGGALLIALIVLPLYVPTLIFGIGAVNAITQPPGDFVAPFLILLAISLGSLVLAPLAAAGALRLQLG